MKKFVFSFVMMLALIVFAGTNSWAQNGNGQTISTSRYILEGASTTHTITLQGGTGNTTLWEVLVVSSDPGDAGEPGTAAADADYNVVADGDPGDATITVKWLIASPANTLYAVQVTETASTANGNCTTIRRSYISVFGFDVDVFLATNNAGAGATGDSRLTRCNTWTGTVVDSLTAAEVTDLDIRRFNNPVDDDTKIDSTFWGVTITLIGGGGIQLDDLKWRFFYSFKTDSTGDTGRGFAAPDFYSLHSYDAPRFDAEPGEAGALALVVPGTLNTGTITADNVVYVPAGSAGLTDTYHFGLYQHIKLGSAPTDFAIRVDSANVEFTLTAGDGAWDNGSKYHPDVNTGHADFPEFSDGMTWKQIVNQGPATPLIIITD